MDTTIEHNDISHVREILQQVTDVKELYFSLYAAIDHKRMEIIRLLLEAGLSPDVDDGYGGKPLHYATEAGYDDVVNLLLEYGANINLGTDDTGNTPLMVAVEESDSDMIKLLLTKGADPNIQDSEHYNTALHRVVRKFSNKRSLFGTDSEEEEEDCHDVPDGIYAEIVDILLSFGANHKIRNKKGITPENITDKLGYKGFFENHRHGKLTKNAK